jgi:hypothetical protein
LWMMIGSFHPSQPSERLFFGSIIWDNWILGICFIVGDKNARDDEDHIEFHDRTVNRWQRSQGEQTQSTIDWITWGSQNWSTTKFLSESSLVRKCEQITQDLESLTSLSQFFTMSVCVGFFVMCWTLSVVAFSNDRDNVYLLP